MTFLRYDLAKPSYEKEIVFYFFQNSHISFKNVEASITKYFDLVIY